MPNRASRRHPRRAEPKRVPDSVTAVPEPEAIADEPQAQPEPEPLADEPARVLRALDVDETPPDEPRYTAKLTADEVTRVRLQNEAVDMLTEDIKLRTESLARQQRELLHLQIARDAAQRDQLAFIRGLIDTYALARGITYQVDIDNASLVPIGPAKS